MKNKTLQNSTTKFYILLSLFITFVSLCATSCSCNKEIEKSCILKDPRYKEFVQMHNLENDVNDFLHND